MKRALLLALMLSGCAAGPDYHRPAMPEIALAEQSATAAPGTPLPDHWWQLYQDPTIDRLVEKALAHNADVRVAAANLGKARSALGQARAATLPDATATAAFRRQRTQYFTGATDGPALAAVNAPIYAPGGEMSYELDIAGGISRSVEAARADAGAAQAALDAARVSVAGETVRAYVTACGYAAQADVARETLDLQQRTLDLTQHMLDGGRGTLRDVEEARVLVSQARSQPPVLDAEHRAALYALATLTGDLPEAIDATAQQCRQIPQALAAAPSGDGRALLARRPDVAQAERRLAADVARIGVATADLYPHITLLGSGGLSATSLSGLGAATAATYAIGPSISWNLPFNGAARARLRGARAQADASLASFDKAVQTALQETEQALARLGGAQQREADMDQAASASAHAAGLTETRFRAGSDTFLQLLDSQRSLASARNAAIQARMDRALAQVTLFKALGGGWQQAPEVAVRHP